jgi:putative DNA primase/helicase
MSIPQLSNNVDNFSTLDMREYALALHALGFNPIPVHARSKAASIEWKEYQQRPLTKEEVASFDWHNKNIASISGPNGLLELDFDGCTDANIHFQVVEQLGLDPDYAWTTLTPGNGGGFHTWIRCNEPLPFLNGASVLIGQPLQHGSFHHVELRVNKCYTVLPPSLHPENGEAYQWAFNDPVLQANDKQDITPIAVIPAKLIEAAFFAVATLAKEPNTLEQAIQKDKKNTDVRYDGWAQKAFNQELEILQNTPEGGRNNQLNKSAFNLGQIIGAKLLDRWEVEEYLTRVANNLGLAQGEIAATMKSGIESGCKKPRMPKQVFQSNEPPLQLPKIKDIDDHKLASFSLDDQGNAEAVFSLYGQYIAYNEAYGWLVWNGTHFVPSIQRINTIIVATLRHRMQAARHLENTELAKVSKAMAACRTLLENLAFVEAELFDDEPDLLNVKNGVVDLRTKQLLPHNPEYRFTWCIAYKFLPNADATLWQAFLKETFPTQDIIDYVQMSMGYSVTGHTSEECLFYGFGPSRSGKGTYCEAIMNTMPRNIIVEVDFNTFTAKRENDSQNFDLAPLKAARIVFASESNKYQSLNPAKVKQLTGGNLVQCAFKHKDMFTYRPQAAFWLFSNHEINADADDPAVWGRLRVVPFPNSRLGAENKELKFRLKEPDVATSIVTWYIEGAYQWYQRRGKGLVTPQAVKEITQQQRDAQDSIGLWLDECCDRKEGNWIENSIIYNSYRTWCENNGCTPKQQNQFSKSLNVHGLQVGVQKPYYNASGVRTTKKGVVGVQTTN